MFVCGVKLSRISEALPQGVVFPKYVTFSKAGMHNVLLKQTDLKRVASGAFVRIQRYIIPYDFLVRKLLVRWRRTKSAKVYSLTSLLPLKSKKSSLSSPHSSDNPLQYFASLSRMDSCKVRKETKVSEDVFRSVRSVLTAVQACGIAPHEQLEECLVSLARGADGVLYFLDCSQAKVATGGDTAIPAVVRDHSLTLPHVRSVGSGVGRHRQFKTVVTNSVVHGQLLARTAAKSLTVRENVVPHLLKSQEIAAAVDSLDKLRERTKAHMELSNFFHNLKTKDAKEGFFRNIMHAMYEGVSNEPKLCKFFPKNSQTVGHIKTSIGQVFLEGKHISRLKEIHKNLGITEADFALYLKYFAEAFTREGGVEAQIALAIAFLTSFKDHIVTKRRVAIREGGVIEDLG